MSAVDNQRWIVVVTW